MGNKLFQLSESLTIRTLETTDAQELFEVVNKNRKHLREWLPWVDCNIEAADSEAFIEIIKNQ